MDFSLIIPCYNEEGNVAAFFDEAEKVLDLAPISYEYVFVNDGSSDQTEAAIITPAAKPSRDFSVLGDILSFNRNTIAEPREVPTKGMNSVIKVVIISSDAPKSDKKVLLI